jgi:dihydroorotase-like cyclic amidohydrolase
VALLLRGGRVVDPAAGLDLIADVVIRDGRIVEIGQDLKIAKGETIECSEKVILPGLVDVHAHLREPGREATDSSSSRPTRSRSPTRAPRCASCASALSSTASFACIRSARSP